MPYVSVEEFRILDRFLLVGDVPSEDLDRLLRRARGKRGAGQLPASYWLADRMPETEEARMERLVKLRVALAGQPPPPSRWLVARLTYVCFTSRLLRCYIRGEIDGRALEVQLGQLSHSARQEFAVRGTTSTESIGNVDETDERTGISDLGIITIDLRDRLAHTTSSEPHVERDDAVNLCVEALNRLEGYWYAILG